MAPYAVVIGLLSGGIQLLIWLWSASSYLLTPLMALVVLALGAVCGSLLSFGVAAGRTTKREREAIFQEVRPPVPESGSLHPERLPSAMPAPRTESVAAEAADGPMAEPIVIRVVRQTIGARLGAVLLVLTTATLVVSVLSALDQPEKLGAARLRSTTTTNSTTTTTTTTTAPTSTSSTASTDTTVSGQGTALGRGGAGVVLVNEGCASNSEWKESELVIDGRYYDRGAFQMGGACFGGASYDLSTITYVLSKQYSRFTVHVGIIDSAPPISPIRVELVIDDAEQFKERYSVRVGEPAHIDTPVTDVVRVTIRVYMTNSGPDTPLLGVAGGTGYR